MNHAGAVLATGAKFLLGASTGTLVNDGTLVSGGEKLARVTEMTGSFVQGAGGTTLAELDLGSNTTDEIRMDGTARLAGAVSVSLLNPHLVQPGTFRRTLFAAAGGVVDDGIALLTTPSVVIGYRLPFTTGYAAELDYSVDFSPSGAFGANLEQVGDYINRIQAAGSSPALADTVSRLIYDPTIAAYRQTLLQLAPDFFGEQQAALLRGSQRFSLLLADGDSFPNGAGPAIRERRLIRTESGAVAVGAERPASGAQYARGLFVNVESQQTRHLAHEDYQAVQHRAGIVTIGIERPFGDGWTAGLGFALEDNSADGYGDRWGATGHTQHVGAMVGRVFGATRLAGVLSYSANRMDSRRSGQVTAPFTARLSRDLADFSATLRASHHFGRGRAYLTPALAVGYSHLLARSGSETGAGATSLALGRYDQPHLWVRPALGLGYLLQLASGSGFHFFAEAGYQHYAIGRETTVKAGFAGAPAGVPLMEVPIDLGSHATGAVGIDYTTPGGVVLGLRYSRVFSSRYRHDLGRVKMEIPF